MCVHLILCETLCCLCDHSNNLIMPETCQGWVLLVSQALFSNKPKVSIFLFFSPVKWFKAQIQYEQSCTKNEDGHLETGFGFASALKCAMTVKVALS